VKLRGKMLISSARSFWLSILEDKDAWVGGIVRKSDHSVSSDNVLSHQWKSALHRATDRLYFRPLDSYRVVTEREERFAVLMFFSEVKQYLFQHLFQLNSVLT
jgi:hypothetical protein